MRIFFGNIGRTSLHRYLLVIISPNLFGPMGFPGSSDGTEFSCNAGDLGLTPDLVRFPGGGHGNPTPVFLPGESPWSEEPGGLQSMGSQRVRHD